MYGVRVNIAAYTPLTTMCLCAVGEQNEVGGEQTKNT